MTPLEKLNAAAGRLIQETGSMRDQQQIRIREIAATIRDATATIRAALEETATRPRHAKFRPIIGDEAGLYEDDTITKS